MPKKRMIDIIWKVAESPGSINPRAVFVVNEIFRKRMLA